MWPSSNFTRSRLIVFVTLFAVGWVIVVVRAAFVQIWPNERLHASQKRLYEKAVQLPARRGEILDRNGVELAGSVAAYSLFVDPSSLEGRRQAIQKLHALLRIPVKALQEKMSDKKKRFVWLARRLSLDQKLQIEGWQIKGLGFIEEYRRIYPLETLASQLLGFVGADDSGLEGMELGQDAILRGQSLRLQLPKDARGRPLIERGNLFMEQPRGANIVLTLDSELQANLEFELAQVFEKYHAESAMGLILDAQTSEILAAASFPAYDPNKAASAAVESRRHRVFTDAFEPGSTLKPFIVAGALQKKSLQPNSRFDCENGRMPMGRRVIRDVHPYKMLSVSEIIAFSSNIGMTKIGLNLGDENIAGTLNAFGFGKKTGVNFPGEAPGVVQKLPWNAHLQSNVSFGQGMTATALQLANAYAVIANGGTLYEPSLVKRIEWAEDDVKDFQPRAIRQVLSKREAETIKLMLTSVTGPTGTGFNARVVGFPVAGKTGTAQKVDPKLGKYSSTDYISSFVGFIPAGLPRFVVLIALDSPRGEYYGSQVAAPVFSRVAGFAVRHAGLLPVHVTEDLPQTTPANEVPVSTAVGDFVPDLKGLTLRQVMEVIAGSDLRLDVRGHGRVAELLPTAGSEIPTNRRIQVRLRSELPKTN